MQLPDYSFTVLVYYSCVDSDIQTQSMSVCLSTFIHYVGSTWYLVLTTELQSTDFNWFIESRPVENLCYDCSHLLDVEEVVGGDAAPGVRVLALQPVLEDALLAPHLLAVTPAALAEQSAHGALVTHWSHPVSGHTLSVVTHWRGHTECGPLLCHGRPWRHQATLPRAASPCWCCHHRPPTRHSDTRPGARRSMSVDLWTLFLLSPHFIEQIKSQHYCHCRIDNRM